MIKIEDTIAALEIKLKQAKSLKQKIEAKKRTLEKRADRARDTRKKILIGAFFMGKMEKNEDYREMTLQHLDLYLTRDEDRSLFEMPPLPVTQTPVVAQ